MPVCMRGDGSSWREKEGLGDPSGPQETQQEAGRLEAQTGRLTGLSSLRPPPPACADLPQP